MNKFWAFFFKDKYRTIFSMYRMSLAEVIILITAAVGIGVILIEGIKYLMEQGV
jgi:hypothetical protein|tara:strand:- start:457 stop:618 length:162 start_codon:yes stop_codon:yes gene_type:complete